MRKFQELAEELPNGQVPMSALFDIAFKQVFGDAQTSDFCALEVSSSGGWRFMIHDSEDELVELYLEKDWSFGFWRKGLPLHINQHPLYQWLFDNEFLAAAQRPLA